MRGDNKAKKEIEEMRKRMSGWQLNPEEMEAMRQYIDKPKKKKK